MQKNRTLWQITTTYVLNTVQRINRHFIIYKTLNDILFIVVSNQKYISRRPALYENIWSTMSKLRRKFR